MKIYKFFLFCILFFGFDCFMGVNVSSAYATAMRPSNQRSDRIGCSASCFTSTRVHIQSEIGCFKKQQQQNQQGNGDQMEKELEKHGGIGYVRYYSWEEWEDILIKKDIEKLKGATLYLEKTMSESNNRDDSIASATRMINLTGNLGQVDMLRILLNTMKNIAHANQVPMLGFLDQADYFNPLYITTTCFYKKTQRKPQPDNDYFKKLNKGHEECVRLLLQEDLKWSQSVLRNTLVCACENGNVQIVSQLLETMIKNNMTKTILQECKNVLFTMVRNGSWCSKQIYLEEEEEGHVYEYEKCLELYYQTDMHIRQTCMTLQIQDKNRQWQIQSPPTLHYQDILMFGAFYGNMHSVSYALEQQERQIALFMVSKRMVEYMSSAALFIAVCQGHFDIGMYMVRTNTHVSPCFLHAFLNFNSIADVEHMNHRYRGDWHFQHADFATFVQERFSHVHEIDDACTNHICHFYFGYKKYFIYNTTYDNVKSVIDVFRNIFLFLMRLTKHENSVKGGHEMFVHFHKFIKQSKSDFFQYRGLTYEEYRHLMLFIEHENKLKQAFLKYECECVQNVFQILKQHVLFEINTSESILHFGNAFASIVLEHIVLRNLLVEFTVM